MIMKRQELMKKLETEIPSFNREYKRWGEKVVDKNKDKSWVYIDEPYYVPGSYESYSLPEKIPVDYLVGLTGEVDGTTYTSKSAKDIRKVALSIVDFGLYGNTHKYGTLNISGCSWTSGTCVIMSNELSKIDPRVRGVWNVDLRRIVPEGEMDVSECKPFDATQRFCDVGELIATAVYVCLLRIEGPFDLIIGEYYESQNENNTLISVDSEDNVTENY